VSLFGFVRKLFGFSEISLDRRRKFLAGIERRNQEVFKTVSGRAKYLKEFYLRYDRHLRSGLSEEHFLKEELDALNHYAKGRDEKLAAASKVSEPTVLNEIVAGIDARLDQYEQLSIHPKAHREIECLYGFMVFFEKKYHPLILKTVQNLPRHSLDGLTPNKVSEHLFSYRSLAVSTSGRIPSSFETYRQNISNLKKDDDVQKEGQKILKEAYVLLKETRKICLKLKANKESEKLQLRLPGGQAVSAESLLLAVVDEINEAFYAFRFKGLDGY
jgi:hypothetical protein